MLDLQQIALRASLEIEDCTLKLFSYGCSYYGIAESYKECLKEGIGLKPEELEIMVTTLRELGLSYNETAKLMSEAAKDVKALRSLWGKPNAGGQKSSRLIKLGVSLIAFPIPTIGIKKSLGAMLIAAGLVQEDSEICLALLLSLHAFIELVAN